MGSSPSIPSYKAPSGAPGFTPSPGIWGGEADRISSLPGVSNLLSSLGAEGIDWTNEEGRLSSPELQSVFGNAAGYRMSDADFAARYPQYVAARNQYQGYINNLFGGTQGPGVIPTSIASGQTLSNAGQAILPSAAQTIGTGQGIINSAPTIINQGQNSINQGQAAFNQGQGIVNQGLSAFNRGGSIVNQGQGLARQAQAFLSPAARLAAGAQATGQPDISLGQKLISGQQAIDPLVQQELMSSGLQGAASSLGGAAALGGQAGQAAVGRNLGVGAANWINQQRQQGMALQQTGMGLTSGMAGAAGTLAGAGTGVAGAGSGLINAGTGVMSAGTGLANTGVGYMNAGTGMAGTGAGIVNAGSGVIGAGTGVINAGNNILGTASGAMQGGQNIINQSGQLANQTMGVSSNIFQPRQFGLTGADLANISLANTAGQNNLNQFIYGTKVQGAQYNTQIAGANASAAAQSQGNLIQGGVGAASAAATVATAFAMSCWVARETWGGFSPKFHRFRFWLLNVSPRKVRSIYMKRAKGFASYIHTRPLLKAFTSIIMEAILIFTPHVPTRC